MTGDELRQVRLRLGVARVTVARWEIGLRRVPELAVRPMQHVAKEVKEKQKKNKKA